MCEHAGEVQHVGMIRRDFAERRYRRVGVVERCPCFSISNAERQRFARS